MAALPMHIRRFIFRSLVHYRKKHLLLAAGIAISGAVITGAMMVGDSVKYSLGQIVEQRLGHVTHVFRSGDRYFTGDLARSAGDRLGVPSAPVLLQEGSASARGGRIRVSRVSVLGVDGSFDQMAGSAAFYGSLSGDTVILSENLARRLNAGRGDEVLLRVQKASLVPRNAPFVSEEGNLVTLRAVVREVAGEEQLGRFNLKVSQTAPFNVFISLSRLQELMDMGERANVLLFSTKAGPTSGEIMEELSAAFSAADAGLSVSATGVPGQAGLTSGRVFLDDTIYHRIMELAPSGEGIITYFVNALSHMGDTTPYSFVSTLPGHWLREDEVVINRWLADDLGIGQGDSVRLDWFRVGPLRELTEASAGFTVRAVVDMDGRFGDSGLMPDIPGLSDVGNCRDWETGVPIDLGLIRDKDEDYWDDYGGTPKAFISVEKAEKIWSNRFGTYTSVRFDNTAPSDLIEQLKGAIRPETLGYTLEPVMDLGSQAARNGVDFSQLFAGLSFFLLAAGILLTILLFLFNLESREEQMFTLRAMGIPARKIRGMLFRESLVVAAVGSLAGLALAVLYNRLVFLALNGVWKDVVRTEMMAMEVRGLTLLAGFGITLAVALAALWFPLARKLKRMLAEQPRPGREATARSQTGKKSAGEPAEVTRRLSGPVALISALAAAVLIALQLIAGEAVSIGVFFPAGGLLLLSFVTGFHRYLGSRQAPSASGMTLQVLGWKNATRNRTRSMGIVVLFAIGAFLVVTTGSNRKDLFDRADDPASGTGGFLYYAESTVPVLRQLNDPEVRSLEGLSAGYTVAQLRLADGDDASCLNLNKISNPRILGVDPVSLEGRFSFVTRTGFLDDGNPWASLEQALPGGLIPAIADETVIKWGLGMTVGDTLRYTNASGGQMELLLVGGLAPSIFQGNVIISQRHFLEQFPASSGSHVFLVEGEAQDTALIRLEMERTFRDLGWDMQLAAVRLSEFNSVTNAYLSIFMVMGALGLLIGIFGLAVVLSRSVLERRSELALLRAVGFGRTAIRRLIVREYLILLAAGIGSGFATAVIATLPALTSSYTGASLAAVLFWLGILLLNGWIWIQVVARTALGSMQIRQNLSND